jgi:hypothetical protein
MSPIEFLKSLYFGDRICNKIVINNVEGQLELHVNLISRIKNDSIQWNNYTEEDIEGGILVFTEVKDITFNSSGIVPNDQIYDIYALSVDDENGFRFYIEASNVNAEAVSKDVTITFLANEVYIVDPKKPNEKIID